MPNTTNKSDGSTIPVASTALLLIDVISDFSHPRGEDLLAQALPLARPIRDLSRRARAHGIPVIYVNDNSGQWRWTFERIIAESLRPESLGHQFVATVRPEPNDYFVLKPKHSGFFQTPLEILLKHLGATNLILIGLSTNSCVLFTASDAYMRDFNLYIPSDCVAACTSREHELGLLEMRSNLKADTTVSTELVFEDIRGQ